MRPYVGLLAPRDRGVAGDLETIARLIFLQNMILFIQYYIKYKFYKLYKAVQLLLCWNRLATNPAICDPKSDMAIRWEIWVKI